MIGVEWGGEPVIDDEAIAAAIVTKQFDEAARAFCDEAETAGIDIASLRGLFRKRERMMNLRRMELVALDVDARAKATRE